MKEFRPRNILFFLLFVPLLWFSGCAIQGTQTAHEGYPGGLKDYGQEEDGQDADLYGLSRYPEAAKAIKEAKRYCETASMYWQRGDSKTALMELDRAYSILLGLDPKKYPDLSQPIEDLRYTIAKRILQVQASKARGTKGITSPIPMTMNRHVKEALDNFQGPLRDFFMRSYQRSLKHRPMIVKKLKEAGLPEELSWLPLIESGFNVRAFSPARALGMWQFIASTGHKYGLKRDDWIDERMDPEKSTDAAIAYLRELHGLFGDWTTALAAYNCGEGNVLRVIRTQQIDYLDNFWDLYERLPRETAFYVPQFIAVLHIVNSPKNYRFEFPETTYIQEQEIIEVGKSVSLSSIEGACGLEEGILSSMNPELRRYITPPYSYNLKIPKGKKEIILSAIENIAEYCERPAVSRNGKKNGKEEKPAQAKPKGSNVVYVVKRGDTLRDIAQSNGTTVQALKKLNGLNSDNILVGQRLKIPQESESQAQSKAQPQAKAEQKKAPAHITYRVKKGDSLYSISKRFGMSLSEIMELNNLKKQSVYPGQVLTVRGSS